MQCSSWAWLCSPHFGIHIWPKQYRAHHKEVILERKWQRQTKTTPDVTFQYLRILNCWLWVCHMFGESNEICVMWLRLYQRHVLLSVFVPSFPIRRVKLVQKKWHLNCFFRVEFRTKVCPKLFKYKPSHLKINKSIFLKFIVLKQIKFPD